MNARRIEIALFVGALLLVGISGNSQAQTCTSLSASGLDSLAKGEQLFDQLTGLTVSAQNNAKNLHKALVFDSSNPSAAPGQGQPDWDLGTPNEDFGGPGIGLGGQAGKAGVNSVAQGNLIIIAENDIDSDNNGQVDHPDDEAGGGTLQLHFDEPVTIRSATVVDIDKETSRVDLWSENGLLLSSVAAQDLDNNSVQTLSLNQDNVKTLSLVLSSSGALADVEYCSNSAPDPGYCGDGIIQAGEQCEPPGGGEICNNAIDDDGDGLVDCADNDCQASGNGNGMSCTANCQYQNACSCIVKDPATLNFKNKGAPDQLKIHGRLPVDAAIDLTGAVMRFAVYNGSDAVFSQTVDASAEASQIKLRYNRDGVATALMYKPAAKPKTGPGISKLNVALKWHKGQPFYAFNLTVHRHNLSTHASDASEGRFLTLMHLNDEPFYLHTEWTPKFKRGVVSGWKLQNKDFVCE